MEKIKYFLRYGLGGGFGFEYSIYDAFNEDDANKEAYYLAKDNYDSFDGCGVRSVDDIIEDEECEDRDEAQEIYHNEREDSIDYAATIYDPKIHDEYL